MSSTPSSSSIDFMRSVASLTSAHAFEPSVPTINASQFESGGISKVESAFRRTNVSSRMQSPQYSDDVDTSLEYLHNRVFVNGVDKFNGRHIARFLSQQEFGSLRPPEGILVEAEEVEEVEEVGEELFDDMDFLFAPVKEKGSKVNYTVVGSVLEEGGEYDKENVAFVDHKNRQTFLERLISCGFIVYDISRYPEEIDEARWVLHTLLDELDKLEKDFSVSADQVDVPTFILISSFLTWGLTKPVDPQEPGMPFQEMDYKSRKCHPNFAEHFDFENEVVAAGKAFPHRFKTLVLCSGVTYGFEEDTLNFFFKMAWENEPALPVFAEGKNFIPTIHIQDLAMMLFTVFELFPYKLKYILAVEQSISSVRSITKAISTALSTGEIIKLDREEMLLYDVSQYVFDCLTANVRMEPAYFTELEQMSWTTDSFLINIANVVREYRLYRDLRAYRILICGPPASGKSTLAKRLCEYYQLHHISDKSIGEMSVQKIKDKIERINAKKEAEAQKEMEKKLQEEMREAEDDLGEMIDAESVEEEYVEEVQEEQDESVEKLTAAMEELTQNIEFNDGVLDNEHLFKCAKEILASSPIINQGFVLDGFPENIEQIKMLFEKHDFEGIDEEETRCVDIVIVLVASDDFLIERVLTLPEDEVQEQHYGEEILMKRLADYRNDNSEEFGIMRLMADHDIETIVVPVEEDESPMMGQIFENLRETIGEPHNFAKTKEEKEEEEKATEDAQKWVEAQDLARKQEVEKQMYMDRLKKLEEWALTMDAMRTEEEEMLAADSVPIRNYLSKYIFPTLTRGLLEIARLRPDDPVDFLAEYLFRNNPEGKVLEPDDTHQYRKLFQTIARDIERLRAKQREGSGKKEGEAGEGAEEEEEINILDLQVGERPAGTIY